MDSVPEFTLWQLPAGSVRLAEDATEANWQAWNTYVHERTCAVVDKLWHDPVDTLLDDASYGDLCGLTPYAAMTELLWLWTGEWRPQLVQALPKHLRQEYSRDREIWRTYAQTGVLPIGRDSIRRLRLDGDDGIVRAQRFADIMRVFDGDVFAACSLRAAFGLTRCHAFLVVESSSAGTAEDAVWRLTGDVRFFLSGDPEAGDLPAWRERVRGWARTLSGATIARRAGRPIGTTRFTIDEVRIRITQFVASQPETAMIRRDDFLAFASIPLSTWNDWMRAWNTSWTRLLSESATSRHRWG